MVLKLKEIQELESELLRHIDQICMQNDLKYYLVCGSVLGAIRHQGPIPWDYDVDITVPIVDLNRFCDVMKKKLDKSKYRIMIPGDMQDKNNITTFPRICFNNFNPRKIHIDVFPQIGITSDKEEQIKFIDKLTKVKTDYKNKRLVYTTNGSWWKVIIKKTYLRFKTRKIDANSKLKEFYELCNKYSYENSDYVTNPCGHYGTKNIVPKEFFGQPKRVKYLDMLLPVPEKTEEYLIHYYKDYMKYPEEKKIKKMMRYVVREEK